MSNKNYSKSSESYESLVRAKGQQINRRYSTPIIEDTSNGQSEDERLLEILTTAQLKRLGGKFSLEDLA